MFDLAIISKQARDLVGVQFDDTRRENGRGPARARKVRPHRRKARAA
jgi:hypothetical protein